MITRIICFCCLLLASFISIAQKAKTTKPQPEYNVTAIEKEIREYFDSYAEDMRQHRREAIANRYHSSGYFRMGNGSKTLRSFEETKSHYLNMWAGPKSFEWKDLSIDVLSPDAAVVTGLFELGGHSGDISTVSYTGVLVKKSGKWLIRVEDESNSPLGYTTQAISGSSSVAGPYKFNLKALAGASIAAHRHSADMHIKVVSGKKMILMGDLDSARVQRFDSGSHFVIPANTWHMEWWEEETVEEIEILAPYRTEAATPCTPRKAIRKQFNYVHVEKEIGEKYVGEYQHPTRPGRMYKIFFEKDTLVLTRNWDSYRSPILPISEREFVSVDGLYTSLIFSDIEAGKANILVTTAQCVTYRAKRAKQVSK